MGRTHIAIYNNTKFSHWDVTNNDSDGDIFINCPYIPQENITFCALQKIKEMTPKYDYAGMLHNRIKVYIDPHFDGMASGNKLVTDGYKDTDIDYSEITRSVS